jgi:heterodisulfide reductase subunit A-like polyferredoxin
VYPPAQRAAYFDLQPFWLEKTHWIPAFAGMTMNLTRKRSKSNNQSGENNIVDIEKTGAVVIGAGVVGLACARELAERGIETIIVERHPTFGQETSSRNSEVIHGGL